MFHCEDIDSETRERESVRVSDGVCVLESECACVRARERESDGECVYE